MFRAEADLMRRHVRHLVAGTRRPDVLEIGLGLGVFAEQLLDVRVGSYTAIEPHDEVARLARARVLDAFGARARVIGEPWQLATLPTRAYDAIMYDTWPPDGYADADFAWFVEHVAVACLRPGGRFSFFHSGDAIGSLRRRVLDTHFTSWAAHPYSIPVAGLPAMWTKPTNRFLVPVATLGDERHVGAGPSADIR
ncbi:hypothetical protein [Kitasatospora atroaurantiaca]